MQNSISVSELTIYNDEPRIRDIDVATRLGFVRPRKIRELIARNLQEFERYGVCPTVGRTSGKQGGRPSQEFWLNEGQALLAATLANTEKAADVRHALITVFMDYRAGKLAPANRKPVIAKQAKGLTIRQYGAGGTVHLSAVVSMDDALRFVREIYA